MVPIHRSILFLCLIIFFMSITARAYADCGGNTQCIAVGPTPAAADIAHHGNGPETFTLVFDVQAINTTSAAKTVYVAAVGGGTGIATLGVPNITGSGASSFVLTGTGTCGNPVHGGAQCTILVAYRPVSAGVKTAVLHVPLAPVCSGCIAERVVSLRGSDLNPASDSGIVGVLNAQVQSSKRFSQAQVFNYQQRMETIHRSGVATGTQPGNSIFSRTPSYGGKEATTVVIGQRLSPYPNLLDRNTPLPTSSHETAGSANTNNPAGEAVLDKLMGLAGSGSTRLAYSNNVTETSSGGSPGSSNDFGFWVSGNIGFGTRSQTVDSNKLQFSTQGISVGIDKRYTDKLTLGMGMGYAIDSTVTDSNASMNKATGTSISTYGSYQPTANTYIDTMLGYGVLGHDTSRYVEAASAYARSNRTGKQWFGFLIAGYEHRKNNLLLSPYSRLDFSINQLDRTTENGVTASAVTYYEQTFRSMQFSVGMRAESSHATSFGMATPYARIEYNHDLSENSQSTLIYANQPTATPTTFAPAMSSGNNTILLGLGSDFMLRSGLKLGVDYQTQRSLGPVSSHTIRLWLSKELDGKGDGRGFQNSLLADSLFDNPVYVEAGFTRDDNINRASDSNSKLTDNTYSFNLSNGRSFSTSQHTRILLTGLVGGDKQQQYEGLDRVSAGLNGEFQYRTSGAFNSATFGLFARASLDRFKSLLRSGNRLSTGINVRQPLNENVDMFGALSNNLRNAENSVFSNRDKSLSFNLEYRPERNSTLYLGGEYRVGDTVATSTASIHSAALADGIVRDDAYDSVERNAYRFEARTTLITLGYNMAFGSRDSVDLFWRHVVTASTKTPNYAALGAPYSGQTGPSGPAAYVSNQVGVSYITRF